MPGTHHPAWTAGVTAAVLLTRYPPRGRFAPRAASLVLDTRYRTLT